MRNRVSRSILAIGLVLTMIFSLCACGDDDSKSKGKGKSESKTSTIDMESSGETSEKDSQEETTTETTEEVETSESTSATEDQSTTLKVEETTAQTTTKPQTTKKPQTTTKPQQTTKPADSTSDPNHPSKVNEKLTWTSVGWAQEVNRTTSGNYIYVTNKKQTIDPVKGNGFTMTQTNFSISEWDVMPLDAYIQGKPGTIRWTSEDPSIAQIINNELVGIYAGTTKISGTCGNTTVHITVTVQHGWKSYDVTLNSNLVNLYPGESFQLIATERNTKYTSADSNIVKVSADGMLTGVRAGTTTVTATHNGKSSVCKVIVTDNNGTYMDVSLNTKYTVTKERVLLATDRAFIILDAGVVIEDNLLQNIETIMTKIENVTGYSFTNTSSKITEFNHADRILINVSGYGMAYASNTGVTLAPYDITIQECGAHVLVHELLHTVQHRNTVYCGDALTEGFAEYFGIQVYNDLSFSKNTYDEDYNSAMNMSVAFNGITLTADNMEYYLLNSPDSHPTSYYFVKYLVKTYGKDKIYQIQTAITDEFIRRFGRANGGGINDGFSNQDMFNIIKSMTSQNVAKDFYAYYCGLEKNTMAKNLDLSSQNGTYIQGFSGHSTASFYTLDGGYYTVNGPLVIDFSHAIDYARKIYGRKMKGLNVSARIQQGDNILDDVSVTYYDAAGREVAIPDNFDYDDSLKAVQVKVNMQTAGVVRVFIDCYHTVDSYY